MRLTAERVVGESEISENREFLAMVWQLMRNEVAVQLMEHLEAGPRRVEVLRYTHDEPENRWKRLEYVVLINEAPENRPTVSVPERARQASSSEVNWESVILEQYTRHHRQFPDNPTQEVSIPPQEPTDDWI